MSFSKKHLADADLCRRIADEYRRSAGTLVILAKRHGVTVGTMVELLKREISPEDHRLIKRANYGRSKSGDRNPAKGKRPPNYRGECFDGHGYLTKVVNGKRQFVHRIVMAELIGILVENLPDHLAVHHINQNKTDNSPSNLALVTRGGHCRIHRDLKKVTDEA